MVYALALELNCVHRDHPSAWVWSHLASVGFDVGVASCIHLDAKPDFLWLTSSQNKNLTNLKKIWRLGVNKNIILDRNRKFDEKSEGWKNW